MAIWTGVSTRCFEKGPHYDAALWDRYTREFAARLADRGVHLRIAERPTPTVPALVATLERAVDMGAELLVIDYLQLVGAQGTDSIFDATRRVSSAVQSIAFRRNVVTCGLSQYNRAQSFNREATPRIEGLTGGSSLENDADQVVLLDHTKKGNRVGYQLDSNVILAKNRHGPEETIHVRWNYRTLQVEQIEPVRSASGRGSYEDD
jgi:replicative DNA helicase